MAAAAGKKKGKKGLIIGLVLFVLFGGAGAVVGLAMAGKINIPGLTPKKKAAAPPTAAKPKPKPKVQPKKEEPPVSNEPEPTTKMVDKAGAVKLAQIWNEMEPAKLNELVAKWQPAELSIVLNEMDPEKVAQLLALMKPDQASKVSQELKLVASQVPIEEP